MIACTALVAACNLLKKFSYKNMLITPKTANRIMLIRHPVIRRLLCYLFINHLPGIFEFLALKTISKVVTAD